MYVIPVWGHVPLNVVWRLFRETVLSVCMYVCVFILRVHLALIFCSYLEFFCQICKTKDAGELASVSLVNQRWFLRGGS